VVNAPKLVKVPNKTTLTHSTKKRERVETTRKDTASEKRPRKEKSKTPRKSKNVVFLLEGLTLTLSQDAWTIHIFSILVHVPLTPSNGEVQKTMKTSSGCMVKCWIHKFYHRSALYLLAC
jgi:hypothetical protein